MDHTGFDESFRKDKIDPDDEQTNGAGTTGKINLYCASRIVPSQIPPRGWLLGSTFCRKYLSGIVAAGGVGKTSIRYAQLLACATRRSEICGDPVHVRSRCLIVCLEDDIDDVRRRIAALTLHHKVSAADLDGWLFYCTPRGFKLLASDARGNPVPGELDQELRNAIAAEKIDLVSIDPFVKAHSVDENNNGQIDQVCIMLAAIAQDLDCAVDIVHHARKGAGSAGDADRSRGASALVNAARLVRVATQMAPEEAKLFDIAPHNVRNYVRVDDAKVNITKHAAGSWWCATEMLLGNRSAVYPEGDAQGLFIRWEPPKLFAGLTDMVVKRILDKIDEGLPNGQRYSANNATKNRKAWPVVIEFCPTKTEKQSREIIAKWIQTKVLEERDYKDPDRHESAKGLWVVKRPEASHKINFEDWQEG